MDPGPQSTGTAPAALPCPACGGPTEIRKRKEVCTRCGAIVRNCSGD